MHSNRNMIAANFSLFSAMTWFKQNRAEELFFCILLTRNFVAKESVLQFCERNLRIWITNFSWMESVIALIDKYSRRRLSNESNWKVLCAICELIFSCKKFTVQCKIFMIICNIIYAMRYTRWNMNTSEMNLCVKCPNHADCVEFLLNALRDNKRQAN